jgi:transposase-like protein
MAESKGVGEKRRVFSAEFKLEAVRGWRSAARAR